jgi:hypothetical protein
MSQFTVRRVSFFEYDVFDGETLIKVFDTRFFAERYVLMREELVRKKEEMDQRMPVETRFVPYYCLYDVTVVGTDVNGARIFRHLHLWGILGVDEGRVRRYFQERNPHLSISIFDVERVVI